MSARRGKGITRRGFVAAGLAAAAAPRLGAAEPDAGDGTPQRPAGAVRTGGGFALEEASIAQLQAWMRTGRYTSRGLVDLYAARIAALDSRGPRLRHVIEVNPEARAIAAGLDAERRRGTVRGPLHGIPILVKDNVATADRTQTTAGSLALEGIRPPRDSFVVERLRAAGAVVLGKTNLSEWANFRSTRSTSGWSARGGQCRNPYALDRSPSGSSSGSAVAAAASTCAAAVGTETNGSIVSPASVCGVVGIKPTVGLVSRSGIVPLAHSQDTAGPLARTVADAAVLLTALAGADPRDEVTAEAASRAEDYTRALDADGLRGARVGVVRERLMGFSPKADRLVEEALGVLRERGAVLVDPANVPTAGQFGNATLEVLLYEFKADIAAYLAEWAPGSPMRTLDDLIAFNREHADRELRYFGQELFEQAAAKGPLTDQAYRDARERCLRLSRAEGIDAVMDRERLDALLAPTTGPARPIDLVGGDSGGGGSSTLAAVAGYPHVTVPLGHVSGLPVGLSFFGRAWSESLLVRLAYSFEQATRHRRPPRFRPGPELGPDA